MLALSPLYAFFPTKLLTLFGMLGKSHEEITQDGLTAFNVDFFGGPESASMQVASQEIADKNAAVDDNEQTVSSAHFDGENFTGGQDRITNGLLPRLIDALKQNDASTARDMLGRSLHAVQDFYAHSNWVELGNTAVNTQLGKPGMVIGNTALPTDSTCQNCVDPPLGCPDCSNDLITMKLTSGYYGGEDVVKPGPFKCSHGGVFDTSATGLFGHGINKDNSSLCIFTSHLSLHDKAADLATLATTQYLRFLARTLPPDEIALLLGAGPTLAFTIDTSSQGSVTLGKIQTAATLMTAARQGTAAMPSRFVLVTFDASHVEPAFVTGSPSAFLERIATLSASGPDSCPRPIHAAMLRALAMTDRKSQLFVISDAVANDASLEPAVTSLAVSREAQVFAMSTGPCDAIDSSLSRVALESGGQLFHLAAPEVAQLRALPDALAGASTVQIVSQAAPASATPRVVDFPVDSTVGALTVSVAGTTSVQIVRPDGQKVDATQPGVSFVSLDTGIVATIAEPPSGAWHVLLGASEAASIQVFGSSPLDLRSFRFVKQGGRPGHEGFFPIPGFPNAAGEKATAAISGEFRTASLEARSLEGKTLHAMPMTNGPGQPRNELFGDVVSPDAKFLVHVVGTDAQGQPFQRVVPRPMQAQHVRVTTHDRAQAELQRGKSQTVAFVVTNAGPAATFSILAVDDRGFVTSTSPKPITLETGASAEVAVAITTPENAAPGSTDTLTVVAANVADSTARNFAVVRLQVALPE